MNNLKIIHRGCNLYWLVLWVAAEVAGQNKVGGGGLGGMIGHVLGG